MTPILVGIPITDLAGDIYILDFIKKNKCKQTLYATGEPMKQKIKMQLSSNPNQYLNSGMAFAIFYKRIQVQNKQCAQMAPQTCDAIKLTPQPKYVI